MRSITGSTLLLAVVLSGCSGGGSDDGLPTMAVTPPIETPPLQNLNWDQGNWDEFNWQ